VSASLATPLPQVKTDHELISRAQDGDAQACAAIFDLHRRRVYSTCLLMTKNVSDAEDMMQDAFIQIFRGLSSFRGDSAFSTFLLGELSALRLSFLLLELLLARCL